MRFGRPARDGPMARYAVAWADEFKLRVAGPGLVIWSFAMLGIGVLLLIFGATAFGYDGQPTAGVCSLVAAPIFIGVAALIPWWRENAERAAEINAPLLAGQPEVEPADLGGMEPPTAARRWVLPVRTFWIAYAAFMLFRAIRDDGLTGLAVIAALTVPIGLLTWYVSTRNRRARRLAAEADEAERRYRAAYPEDFDLEA